MRAALVLIIGVTVVLMSGCAAPGAPEPTVQRAGGSIMIAASTEPDAVMEALITGVLTRTPEGCLAVESGGVIHVLEFPFGATLAEDGRNVEVPGLGTVRLGDAIEGGGGYIDLSGVPEECRLDEEVAVWQTVVG